MSLLRRNPRRSTRHLLLLLLPPCVGSGTGMGISRLHGSRASSALGSVRQTRCRGCGGLGPPLLPLRGPPLSFARHPFLPDPRMLARPLHQVPPLLSHSLRSSLSPPPLSPLSSASFTTTATTGAGAMEDPQKQQLSDSEDSDGSEDREHHSIPDLDRICQVIDELLASDRNMETVLDELSVDLSSSLVIGVFWRFRHAHRPSHRFFRWAAGRRGFSHDSATYNAMLRILCKTRQFETVVSFLEEMGRSKLLTLDSFKMSMNAFAAAREMKKAMGNFQMMKKHDFKVDCEAFNSLLDALAKAKLGKEANVLFEKMKEQYPPNMRTYTVLLYGWCKLRNLVEAGRLWNDMLDTGVTPDVVAHNVMLDGFIRAQRRGEAIKLFELMKAKGPSPTPRSYRILIESMCKAGKMDNAVGCFQEMLDSGVAPDAAVYTCLIVGFGNAKRMDKVYGLLSEMTEMGCQPDGRTYNALIKLMTNRGMPNDAARIYKKMISNGIEPTIHTYNMMMKSYFHGNNYDMGCAVWDEMCKKGVCPDVNSYTVFIGGHIRHGRAEIAYEFIKEMAIKGMRAPQIDYNKFAADFSKMGKPEVLDELAQEMSFSGKFEASRVFHHWSERMKKRVRCG